MVQGWVGLCGEFLRHGREVVDELGLSESKPVSSPAAADGAAPCQDDEFKPHDPLDLKYATSCLASAASSPSIGDMRRHLRKAPMLGRVSFFMITGLKNSCATRMPTGLQTRLPRNRQVEAS